MNHSFETLISAKTPIYRSPELLHTVVVCDYLEIAGIPAILRHVSIQGQPGSSLISADEFQVEVPANQVDQAMNLLFAQPQRGEILLSRRDIQAN